jgi:hypothetical protein
MLHQVKGYAIRGATTNLLKHLGTCKNSRKLCGSWRTDIFTLFDIPRNCGSSVIYISSRYALETRIVMSRSHLDDRSRVVNRPTALVWGYLPLRLSIDTSMVNPIPPPSHLLSLPWATARWLVGYMTCTGGEVNVRVKRLEVRDRALVDQLSREKEGGADCGTEKEAW